MTCVYHQHYCRQDHEATCSIDDGLLPSVDNNNRQHREQDDQTVGRETCDVVCTHRHLDIDQMIPTFVGVIIWEPSVPFALGAWAAELDQHWQDCHKKQPQNHDERAEYLEL